MGDANKKMHKEEMNLIKVLAIFPNTSIGEIAIFDFPENRHPQLGMILKRSDKAAWKITGMAFPKLSSMTNGFKYFEPERFVYDCKIEALNPNDKLKVGDTLYE